MWYKGLKQLRTAVHMSSKELAEKIGKSPSYISRLESGSILNTSYENVLQMARVIANSDAIVNGEVNLDDYDSEFAKLVFGCRYKQLKSVYDFSMENKYAEAYANSLQYFQKSDWDMLRILGAYRSAEALFEDAKEDMKKQIMAITETDSMREAEKVIDKDGYCYGEIELKIPTEFILNANYEEIMNVVADQMHNETQYMKDFWSYGGRAICDKETAYYSGCYQYPENKESDGEDKEIEMEFIFEKPRIIKKEDLNKKNSTK